MAATQFWISSAAGEDVIVDADISRSPITVLSSEQLASIITHECGQAIGLGHSLVENTLTSGPPDAAYGPGTDLTPDDVRGCRCLYGPQAGVQAGFLCSLPSKRAASASACIRATSSERRDLRSTQSRSTRKA